MIDAEQSENKLITKTKFSTNYIRLYTHTQNLLCYIVCHPPKCPRFHSKFLKRCKCAEQIYSCNIFLGLELLYRARNWHTCFKKYTYHFKVQYFSIQLFQQFLHICNNSLHNKGRLNARQLHHMCRQHAHQSVYKIWQSISSKYPSIHSIVHNGRTAMRGHRMKKVSVATDIVFHFGNLLWLSQVQFFILIKIF